MRAFLLASILQLAPRSVCCSRIQQVWGAPSSPVCLCKGMACRMCISVVTVRLCRSVRVYLFLRRCMRGSFYSAYTCADIDIFLHSSAWFWLCLWTLIEVGNPRLRFVKAIRCVHVLTCLRLICVWLCLLQFLWLYLWVFGRKSKSLGCLQLLAKSLLFSGHQCIHVMKISVAQQLTVCVRAGLCRPVSCLYISTGHGAQ